MEARISNAYKRYWVEKNGARGLIFLVDKHELKARESGLLKGLSTGD